MEKRLLLAFVLSAVIFAVWSVLFPPPKRPDPTRQDGRPQPEVEQQVDRIPTAEPVPSPAAPVPESAPVAEPTIAVGAIVEERARLVNDLVAVELTNRGAAITSFELLAFRDDEGGPLDLVQTIDHPERSLPLQLVNAGGPDERLYVVERGQREIVFRWADGLGAAVTKRMALPESSYSFEVEIELEGNAREGHLSVGTGLRDLGTSERKSRLARWGDAALLADGEYQTMRRDKVKDAQNLAPRSLAFAGFHDTYFLSLLRPGSPVPEVRIKPLEFFLPTEGEEPESVRALTVLLRTSDGRLRAELLGAPKQYDLLQDIGGGVERTLDFGFFGPISVLFLKALWWIHGIVGNYGVAIVLLTVAIRLLLFPLMHTSTVSMRKMQRLQPQVKEIQAKYKKKKSDPQARAKMNQETMALYKQEGVNPMGGCLPMLVQLPILFALYKLFLQAIELRHAPFMLWIHDLSAKDPYYITPILMTATMWLQQRMAPQAGDPQQQRIMRMLPLVFGIMFLQFPSGLVLYWLTNNVITIIQQEVTLHLVGERKRGAGSRRNQKGTTK
jgi:YidC/Oxa1 family membrane protein insertase